MYNTIQFSSVEAKSTTIYIYIYIFEKKKSVMEKILP